MVGSKGVLPLKSLNHISIMCRSVEKSLDFYQNVLGFVPVRRPGSFDFDGAWLFNYGIGIHLIQSEDPDSLPKKADINPKDNHISFQGRVGGAMGGGTARPTHTPSRSKNSPGGGGCLCGPACTTRKHALGDDKSHCLKCESMLSVEKKLKEMGIDYVQSQVEVGGVYVDQLFFHDPDGFMIEICNCDNIPVIPLGVGEPLGLCKRASLMKQQAMKV